ncbi:cryptochrome/photolyase family protein [Azohydromonas aeria]|uniref:cryptochrome/photolyase family protein n=1 Tax=Azohydromonas aeria TaxID=2590212 RepID=UPI0012F9593D|nr:deoxyribodipyrimidine photo-lyase [Azohydromonas aeria]
MRRFYSRVTLTPVNKDLDTALVWFRRDLRADDQAALYHALRHARRVWCAFVFDTELLAGLPRQDRRVEFIRDSLVGLDAQLRALGAAHGTEHAGLIVRHGRGADEIVRLAQQLHVQAVYLNHDDDPAALERDARVRGALAEHGIALHGSKDHVVFERNEVLSGAGTPYAVFTPYFNAWLKKLDDFYLGVYPVARHAAALAAVPAELRQPIPSLESLGFETTNLHQLKLPTGPAGGQALLEEFLAERIDRYDATRDFPAVKGPSYLGTHLRFGTVSVRQLAREAWRRAQAGSSGARVWLSELAWRDFFQQIVFHHPRVVEHAYRAEFDRIKWEKGKHADALFAAWCEGRTGYPLVDAAMLQLAQSGYQHNRLRMVTASFLVKDLGLDYRRGERWFALKLNDYELASNNGNWQWAAGTGCDPQPWFRIFHPVNQSRKFDPQGRFIRRYLPQLARLPDDLIHAPWLAKPVDLEAAGIELGVDYPLPIVDHEEARQKTLARYAVVKEAKAAQAAARAAKKAQAAGVD